MKKLLEDALDALEASEEYITALRQYIYGYDYNFRTKEHLNKLDTLSQNEWPLRERTVAEIKKYLGESE